MKLHETIETLDEKGNPVVIYAVPKKVMYMKSESNPGVKYRVERARTGKCFCTCKGFMYRQTCRHVEKAKLWK